MQAFDDKLKELQTTLNQQAQQVRQVFSQAVDAYFNNDVSEAQIVIDADVPIDRVDVEIERACIPLLGMGETDETRIRSVLTIVKVNNELERIADCAVSMAEIILVSDGVEMRVPPTFRMMANSVIGMVRDAVGALRDGDVARATQVLSFDDTIAAFKREILLDAQRQVAQGSFTVEFAFRLHGVVKAIERIADHCTNICEQVIYLYSGQIVRHLPHGWTQPSDPDAA
ncbi:MAG: phosphate signaling complex protein PhoU [Phycisphaerales bacterium]